VIFDVSAEAYDRFMGRFSKPLATEFVRLAEVRAGQRVLDVGCGPGALTAELVRRVGPESVFAIDPSPSFVAAIGERHPQIDVRVGVVEQLPFSDNGFDSSLAQLVVHFMTDPVVGLREMARVTRSEGWVAACVWDHAGGAGPLSTFWAAVHDVDPNASDEARLAGAREGHLAQLCEQAGLTQIESSRLSVTVAFASFEDWWEPFTGGVGPAGAYVAGLDSRRVAELRNRCQQLLPPPPFEINAAAWCVRAQP
jgi:SAM-dependent methyltransferase